MAWRNPQFAHIHKARDLGVSALTPDGAYTGSEKAYLIDDRPSVQFTWDTPAAANHTIDLNIGASFADYDLDRLWIPNHDMAGAWVVYQDDNAGFTSGQQVAAGTAVAGTDIDTALSPVQSEQYLRFQIVPSGAWSLGQLMFTKTITTTAGTDSGWPNDPVPDVLTMDNGDTLQLGPDRRSFELTYPYLGDAAETDLTKIEALIDDVSTYRPFLFDPPYDDQAVMFAKIERVRRVINPFVAASTNRRAEITLKLLEYLG